MSARKACDVMLCAVRALPLERRKLGPKARGVWRYSDRHDRRTRAEHKRYHSSSTGFDTARFGTGVWIVGRKYLSGRTDLRTTFLSPAGAGLGTVSLAD